MKFSSSLYILVLSALRPFLANAAPIVDVCNSDILRQVCANLPDCRKELLASGLTLTFKNLLECEGNQLGLPDNVDTLESLEDVCCDCHEGGLVQIANHSDWDLCFNGTRTAKPSFVKSSRPTVNPTESVSPSLSTSPSASPSISSAPTAECTCCDCVHTCTIQPGMYFQSYESNDENFSTHSSRSLFSSVHKRSSLFYLGWKLVRFPRWMRPICYQK